MSSSDPVRHASSTAASAATASNDISFTAVVPLASSAPMSQGACAELPVDVVDDGEDRVGREIGPLVLRVDIGRAQVVVRGPHERDRLFWNAAPSGELASWERFVAE